jgi:NADH-quinone oxidoreductase subunit N
MKYFVLGALASGILLYGMSLLYGLTGSLSLAELASSSAALAPTNLPLLTAVVLIVAGLLFKLGVVPFHMWVPDVYDGSATSTTLFLSSVPKLAAFAIMLRLLAYGLGDWVSAWQDMLAIAAVLSISVGNIVAIAQTSIKRMLGYSTISHMGFLLLGFLGGTAHGYSASLSYVLIYTVITLGAFGIILLLSKPQFESDALNDLKGLNHSRPGLAFLMLIVMFSLAGVPPTAGFFAKLLVLQAAFENGFLWTVIVAVVMAVVGAFYYLRVVKLMYFDLPDKDDQVLSAPELDRGSTAARWVLTANVLSLVLVVPWIGNLVDWLTRALGDFGRL